MDDLNILDLYWARSEAAIEETARKYGAYCTSIAGHILSATEDREECVSDTWLKAWNTIPPQRPARLAVFLGKITRNLALDRLRYLTAQKRSSGQVPLALEELRDTVPAGGTPEQAVGDRALAELLNGFLAGLSRLDRIVFLRRYWYLFPVSDIARITHLTESAVKMRLLRTRNRLRAYLEQEGVSL